MSRRWLVFVALLLPAALLLPLLSAQAPQGKKYAFLVGVNRYQHGRLPALAYAEADVTDLAKILGAAGYQVTLLSGAAADENHKPTKANIEQQMGAVLRGCRRGDTVLLAFAGHGLQFEKQKPADPDDAFFCPVDARPFRDETDTLVSLRKVYGELDKSFAGMKVLLVDACRDDPDAARGARGVNADSAPRPPQGVAALFSCRAGERAFEHEKLGHGVFFYHVLEGLRGGAKDAEGEVTFAGLAAYVSRRVTRQVPTLVGGGARQSPNLKADYSTEPVLVTVQELEEIPGQRPALLRAPFGQAKAREAQVAWAKYLGRKVEESVDLGGGVSMEFVLIPPGTFTMGSPKGEIGHNDNEAEHEVTLPSACYLGKYTVTQEQYQRLMNVNPSWFSPKGAGATGVTGQNTQRFPVESVSWNAAVAFCAALEQKTGLNARLPSEAQWEYACRAGTITPFHFGSSLNGSQANCDGNNPYGTKEIGAYLGRTCTLGSYPPNAFGLYDMHGNVWQWCEDALEGGVRVYRGGCWNYSASFCRAAYRFTDASRPLNSVGFRLARVPSGKQGK